MNDYLHLGQRPVASQERDAVHVAIIPAVAGERLRPGQQVELTKEGLAVSVVQYVGLGVVDPFLFGDVLTGERFWLMLWPGAITSLRHEWTHPRFPLPGSESTTREQRKESEEWLNSHARRYLVDVDDLIEMATNGEGIVYGTDAGRDWGAVEENVAVFWMHIERVTGRRFAQDYRDTIYFSCSC